MGNGSWPAEVSAFTSWMVAANRSKETIRLRRYHLSRVAESHRGGPWGVTTDDLTAWLAAQPWGAETRRSYRGTLSVFYGWGMMTGRTSTNPAAQLPTVPAPRGLPRPASEDVLRHALEGATPRVRLMLLLGAHAGLRRAEIARVHTDDVESDLLGPVLRVTGKGSVVRRVPLSSALAILLGQLEPGWAFPSPLGGHLTPAHVGKLISAQLGPGVTPHQLRHRFASRAYAAERDLRAVQELLGHAKPETTARYTAVPLDAARRAVDFASAG